MEITSLFYFSVSVYVHDLIKKKKNVRFIKIVHNSPVFMMPGERAVHTLAAIFNLLTQSILVYQHPMFTWLCLSTSRLAILFTSPNACLVLGYLYVFTCNKFTCPQLFLFSMSSIVLGSFHFVHFKSRQQFFFFSFPA